MRFTLENGISGELILEIKGIFVIKKEEKRRKKNNAEIQSRLIIRFC